MSDTELKSNFRVVLRPDLPPLVFELFSHYTGRVVSELGNELLYFNCTKIDDSHFHYLSVESFLPGDVMTDSLKIPHQYVLLISGGDDRRQIGFVHPD